jgi:hypothetical protein
MDIAISPGKQRREIREKKTIPPVYSFANTGLPVVSGFSDPSGSTEPKKGSFGQKKSPASSFLFA